MNVIVKGVTKDILNSMVELGYANTQSEAIRLAIVSFGKEHINEIEAINSKLDKIDKDIKSGNRIELNEKEALGNFK